MTTLRRRIAPAPAPSGPSGHDAFEWPPTQHDLDMVHVYAADGRAVGRAPLMASAEEVETGRGSLGSPVSRRLRLAFGGGLAAALVALSLMPSRQDIQVERAPAAHRATDSAVAPQVPPSATSPGTPLASTDVARLRAPAPKPIVDARPVPRHERPVAIPGRPSTDAGQGVDLARPFASDGAASPEPVRPVETIATGHAPLSAPLSAALPERDHAAAAAALAVPPAASAPLPAAAVTASAPNGEMAGVDSARPLIANVLRRYRDAYERGDVAATVDVWPGVDAPALERAFRSIRSQRLVFGACQIEVTGEVAQAACPGTLSYTPRVGADAAKIVNGQWRIAMARREREWRITGVEAR